MKYSVSEYVCDVYLYVCLYPVNLSKSNIITIWMVNANNDLYANALH